MKIKMNENRKHDFRFEVANLITEARYHYKITQKQLAKKVGTQQPSIARIESGSTLPSLSFLERLADSLGTYLIAPQFGFMKQKDEFENKSVKKEETLNHKFDIKSEVPSQYYRYNTTDKKLTTISG